MSRINAITLDTATGEAHKLLTAVKDQLGSVPNIFQTMAQSSSVLEAYLNFNATLKKGLLSPQLAEQIAVTVANINKCDYCASAHTALGRAAGIDKNELSKNLDGNSDNSKTQAALRFCKEVVESRGNLSNDSVSTLRDAGYTDGELIELIAHIAINTFTNYFNRIAQTEIDFPVVNT